MVSILGGTVGDIFKISRSASFPSGADAALQRLVMGAGSPRLRFCGVDRVSTCITSSSVFLKLGSFASAKQPGTSLPDPSESALKDILRGTFLRARLLDSFTLLDRVFLGAFFLGGDFLYSSRLISGEDAGPLSLLT